MSPLLSEACKETKTGSMTLKESVRHMGNRFLNAVETSEQECCYDLLELPITQSLVKIEFISTCKPDDRVFIAKSDELLKQLSPESEDVKLACNIDKYALCPHQLEQWCLADFVSYLELTQKHSSGTVENDSEEDNVTNPQSDEDNSSTQETNDNLFPINVQNGMVIKKCTIPKVICSINYRKKIDTENFLREPLLLYTP